MKKKTSNNMIIIVVLLVLVVNVLSTFIILKETYGLYPESQTTANAVGLSEGQVDICINQAPSIIFNCSPSMTQNSSYYCQVEGTDNETTNLDYFIIPQDLDSNGSPISPFNISVDGQINFTPTNDDVGNWSTLVCVDDNYACSNSQDCVLFEYWVSNINDKPYLVDNISNQQIANGTTLYALLLNDYFVDPDNDPLSYTYQVVIASGFINITIEPDSMLVLRSAVCADTTVYFIAEDPYGATARSNDVIIESVCENDQGEDDQGEGEDQGSGGGSSSFCKSEWYCYPWSECYPQGWRIQSCVDTEGCEKEKRYKEECQYNEEELCEENWLCEDWSVCMPDGLQKRECNDLSNCQVKNNIPMMERNCKYVPTCFDNIKNGDELGIDCGGSCEPCQALEMPGSVDEHDFTAIIVSVAIFLLIAILISLFIIYKEQIYESIAEAGWALARHRKKTLLLSNSEKKIMLESITAFNKKPSYEALGQLIRKYYSFAFNLSFEFESLELQQAITDKKLDEDLHYVLDNFKDQLYTLEDTQKEYNDNLGEAIIEELYLIIAMTSSYDIIEFEHEIIPKVITEEQTLLKEIYNRLYNLHTSLQFLQLDVAKKEYLAIMDAYLNLLRESDKELIYPLVQRAYNEVKYVAETLD